VQTERAGRSNGIECATGSCALGGGGTAEVCDIRIHGVPEREDGIAIVSTVRKPWATILGATPVGERLLRKHNWTGRREDTEVCTVARETGKTN